MILCWITWFLIFVDGVVFRIEAQPLTGCRAVQWDSVFVKPISGQKYFNPDFAFLG
jgi:hypothetical protein